MQTNHRQLQQWCTRIEDDFLHSQHALQQSNQHAQQQLEQSHTSLEAQIVGIKDSIERSVRMADDSWHNVQHMSNCLEQDILGSSLPGLRHGDKKEAKNNGSFVKSQNVNAQSGRKFTQTGGTDVVTPYNPHESVDSMASTPDMLQSNHGASLKPNVQQKLFKSSVDISDPSDASHASGASIDKEGHNARLPQLEQLLTGKVDTIQRHLDSTDSLLRSLCDANTNIEERLDFVTTILDQHKHDSKEVWP